MSAPGAKPKPHLAAVREGSFRPDRQSEGAKFAPVDPVEPDWTDLLPGRTKDAKAVQAKAAEVWARVVPALVVSAGLTDPQGLTITDYCVTAARIWQGERELSLRGVVVPTERGMVKNPWTSVLHAYRAHFRSLTGELGLSPSAAARITPPDGGDDEDDVFD